MKTIKIGRNSDNDIVINDKTRTVSRYHAVLNVFDNETITICDNSTNGTFINGVKALKGIEVSVKKGDEIRFGPSEILDWNCVELPFLNQKNATVIDNDVKENYTIGTAPDNRIVISDPGNHVSRHHAILKLKTNGQYYIYDQSTNGTYVNGVKVKPQVDYPVSISDTITLSSSTNLDWNKIPNVSVPKPYDVVSPSPSKEYRNVNVNLGSTTGGTKIWSYFFYATIFLAIVFFSYHKIHKDSNIVLTNEHPQLVDTVPQTVPTKPNIQPTTIVSDISTLYEQNKNAVFVIYTSNGTNFFQGSGFFISSTGVAISNYHVFKDTEKGLESIKTQNGTYKVESVLTSSEDKDYIVFKVAGAGASFPSLKIATSLPKVGEDVFAIGAPEGLELTISKGIVSSLRGNNSIIQTTTEITHGSSGGPLFNMQGEVIGITSAGMNEANLNFAVNIVGLGLERY